MENNSSASSQIQFLSKIEDILPPSTTMVMELSDLLKISTDSAYRRMRGETLLDFNEIRILCNHFKVSFDTMSGSEDSHVTFNFSIIDKSYEGFKEYLSNLLHNMNLIRNSKNGIIYYVSRDMPIFQNYMYPVFAAFKMFYWMKSVMNIPKLEMEKFSMENIPDEFHQLGRAIFEAYSEIPSIEIWTDSTVHSAIKQIEYYWDSGLFKSTEDALRVVNELEQLLFDIQKYAELGSKKVMGNNILAEGNYKFYNSDIEIPNNNVLVEMGDTQLVFHSHHTFYIMSTANKSYVDETRLWIDNLLKKSMLISGISEKQRFQFFKKVMTPVEKLKKRIEDGE